MIVILEGLERTGKSTIAKQFEDRGFVNFKDHNHSRNMSPEFIKERLDATLSFLIQADKNNINVVMDRYHLSEYFYGRYVRGYNSDNFEYIWYIDEVLSHLNTHLILLERDINQEYVKSYPTEINEKDLKNCKDKFNYIWDKSYIKNKSILYSYLDFDIDDFIHFKKKYDFYLASPFFNDEQIKRENKVKNLLRGFGFKVYAPMEHGIVGGIASQDSVTETFKSNVEAINNSEYVIAITDGKDMGTIWEAGYAHGKNIPIVYYAETLGNNPFNIMLSESGIGIFKNEKSLSEACVKNNFYHEEELIHE